MELRYCLFDLRNYRAWSRDKTEGRKTLTPSRRMFSAEDNMVLFKKRRLKFSTRMPRETVRTTWDEVERRKKNLTQSENTLQYRK